MSCLLVLDDVGSDQEAEYSNKIVSLPPQEVSVGPEDVPVTQISCGMHHTGTHFIKKLSVFFSMYFITKEQHFGQGQTGSILMGESNTVVSAYTTYRHLQQYCSHPPICRQQVNPFTNMPFFTMSQIQRSCI